jgi:spermidine synthase
MMPNETLLTYTEIGTPYETHDFAVKEVLLSKQTAFQHVRILDTYEYGKMLVIDGRTQSAKDDEHIYHECLVHPSLAAHPDPRRVLIIGGGEGATLREVLRHPTIERVVMVDIDREVVEQCQKWLPEWHAGAFDDPRVELVFADGKEFVSQTIERFDVVIVDVCDVLEDGPALALYTERFYGDVKARLSDHGILVVQAMELSELDHTDHVTVYQTLSRVFRYVDSYATFVPSFWAMWGFIVASDVTQPSSASAEAVDATLESRGVAAHLRHYDGETHRHVFTLPKAVRAILRSSVASPA